MTIKPFGLEFSAAMSSFVDAGWLTERNGRDLDEEQG
jgi:hypothetical protein